MLGPLFFIMYMNDLGAVLYDIIITIYTDDVTLVKHFSTGSKINERLAAVLYKVCHG